MLKRYSLACALIFAACSSNTDTDTGTGTPTDSGAMTDAGNASVDTGPAVDMGAAADMGAAVDMGAAMDAGEPADMGANPDMGVAADMGDSDAGMGPTDMGMMADAGDVDAGGPADGGPAMGLCLDAQNQMAISSGNIAMVTETCGRDCLLDPNRVQCTTTCLMTMGGLDAPCAGCFAGRTECTITNCVAQCISDVNSPGCVMCQMDNNCISDFETCSGL